MAQAAEVDGGSLRNTTSLFYLLEDTLRTNAHRSALISTHQAAAHFDDLLIDDDDGNERRAKCLQLTYRQLHSIATNVAAGIFVSSSVQPRSTILLLVPNGAEFATLLWASVLARLTITCLECQVEDIKGRLRHVLRTSKPSIVVTPDPPTAAAVDHIIAELRLARPLRICLGASAHTQHWTTLASLATQGRAARSTHEQLLAAARDDDPQRIHSILYTSGSSAQPKACPLRVCEQTHYMHAQAWLVQGEASSLALQQAHPARGIAHLQTLLTWRAGGAVVMTGRSFSVPDIVVALRTLPITFLALSPFMVHECQSIAEAGTFAPQSVRAVQVGGEAVTIGVLAKCAQIFPRAEILVAHGMTEGGGSFRWPFRSTPWAHIPSFGGLCPAGVVNPGSIVRIWDVATSRLCERGESGALHVHSGSIIQHYMFGVSESSFYDEKGKHWFNTGDCAVMDENGIVYILGRLRDAISREGRMIMPAPLENCIERCTGQQCVVVPGAGQQKIFAVLRAPTGIDKARIETHVQQSVGHPCLLDGVLTLHDLGLDDFPINATSKILRTAVAIAVVNYVERDRGDQN